MNVEWIEAIYDKNRDQNKKNAVRKTRECLDSAILPVTASSANFQSVLDAVFESYINKKPHVEVGHYNQLLQYRIN